MQATKILPQGMTPGDTPGITPTLRRAGEPTQKRYSEIGGGIGADGSMRNAVNVPVGSSYRGMRPQQNISIGGKNVSLFAPGDQSNTPAAQAKRNMQGVLYAAPTERNKKLIAADRESQRGVSQQRNRAMQNWAWRQ
jgi:hypothetical protein